VPSLNAFGVVLRDPRARYRGGSRTLMLGDLDGITREAARLMVRSEFDHH
jgi:hypothetical protein